MSTGSRHTWSNCDEKKQTGHCRCESELDCRTARHREFLALGVLSIGHKRPHLGQGECITDSYSDLATEVADVIRLNRQAKRDDEALVRG
jgi:hypothetical protein